MWTPAREYVSTSPVLDERLQNAPHVALLAGARAMDDATRNGDLMLNPAALMAIMWYHAGQPLGCGPCPPFRQVTERA